jgi:hypothetical protein
MILGKTRKDRRRERKGDVMAIMQECPFCHRKQTVRNKWWACGCDLDKEKRKKEVPMNHHVKGLLEILYRHKDEASCWYVVSSPICQSEEPHDRSFFRESGFRLE